MSDIPMEPIPVEVEIEPSAAEEAPRRSNRTVALALASVAVIAAGVFAAVSFSSGSNAPEDPVREMLEAFEQGDVLGMLEQLEPGERDALREPLTDIVEQLNRLEVLEGADLGKITGLDLEFEDLRLDTERVADDMAHVSIPDGAMRYRVDVAGLPLGRVVRELLGDANDDVSSGREEVEADAADEFITTVRRGDTWYVSIGYSAAEVARNSAGARLEDLGPGVEARGADSPEDAVRQLIEAGVDFDLHRAIELLPPGEMGALQDYAGLFLEDAERGAADARDELRLTVSNLELDAETDGDRALVTIEEIAVEGSGPDAMFSVADGCVRFGPVEGDPTELCPGSTPTDTLQMVPFYFMPPGVEPPELSFVAKQPDVGFVVTRVDGQWYVSPVGTMLESLVAVMELAEPRDLDELRDFFDRVSDAQWTMYEDAERDESYEE